MPVRFPLRPNNPVQLGKSPGAALIVMAPILCGPALAADHDAQVWTTIKLHTQLGPRWQAALETQGRFTDDVSDLSKIEISPSLEYEISDSVSIAAGYKYSVKLRTGADVVEHRPWQQIVWTPGKIAGADFALRSRIEQRFFENVDDAGWRLRESFQLTWPIDSEGQWELVGSAEPFFNLNDTDAGAAAGFDELRSFIGVKYKLAPSVSVKTGYLNQFVNRAAGDKVNHILSIGLSVGL